MKFFSLVAAAALLFSSCSVKTEQKTATKDAVDYTAWVDPYIGSDYHGHVFVGANVPFGAVQLGPNNKTGGWDWCSGYHYSDSLLIGFAHTQLSGTGIGDLGDILFMPVSGDYQPNITEENPFEWEALYSHDDETVKAGYYSLFIKRYNVNVELTTSERVGFHKYDYKGEGSSKILIDLKYGTGWDALKKGFIKQVDKNSIEGFRFSTGWSTDQRIFFHTKFSKDIKNLEVVRKNDKLGTFTVLIEFEGNGELLAKTAISPVSEANASKNMAAEVAHWDFAKTLNEAKAKWNAELGKISIETNSEADKRTFYTALYHTMFAPSLFNDHDGSYRGTDREVHPNPGFDNYSVFSLWDTYRAAHPLFTLTQPERVNDFVNSLLTAYEQQGKLPVWHLKGCETNTMVGYHSVPVIADAYLKGYRGFDAEKALEAMKTSALLDEEGQNFIKEMEYIPADKEIESVAKALEYAIDDWCIAAMAKAMGKTEDYELFAKRAQYYKHYFDKNIGFMRGKLANGEWREPYDPIHSSHRRDDFCEGNGWQYTWLVPHDVEGLIELHGGDEPFTKKLDQLFTISSEQVEGASSDITGLIGQYAHGNEPGHHTTYLYTFAGKQWKTAEKIREICTTMYTDKPDGLCGNEDCGQMSAWYILSSMGMYPVNPAAGAYVFGSPMYNEATLNLADGKTFTIKAKNANKANLYIQSVTLNGKPYTKTFITHKQVMEGGELVFIMGNTPNKTFGTNANDRPKSMVY